MEAYDMWVKVERERIDLTFEIDKYPTLAALKAELDFKTKLGVFFKKQFSKGSRR